MIIKTSSNHVNGISQRIAERNITRLSNFNDKYNVIMYITNKNNNNCEFVNGSTGCTKLITAISLPSISDKNTSYRNHYNRRN